MAHRDLDEPPINFPRLRLHHTEAVQVVGRPLRARLCRIMKSPVEPPPLPLDLALQLPQFVRGCWPWRAPLPQAARSGPDPARCFLSGYAAFRATNPPRKYSTNRANQSMPYAWRPGGIFRTDSVTQAELRRLAVTMLLDGKTQQEAADAVGVTRRIVSEWKSRYDEQGDVALDGKKRGRTPVSKRRSIPSRKRSSAASLPTNALTSSNSSSHCGRGRRSQPSSSARPACACRCQRSATT